MASSFSSGYRTPPGASYLGDGRATFSVWAPLARTVELVLLEAQQRYHAMERDAQGYWRTTLEHVRPGARYRFRLDGRDERPDPASRHQPEGVHGPSALVDPAFAWTDLGWYGLPLRDYVIYELHVGTFTAEGTFEAIIPHLPALRELGVTAIELMPVAQFPGARNWGYDGVYLYAPQHSYGGVLGLKRLVDAAHQTGLAVILDVIYNHFGPEGNYLWSVARPFFTDRHRTVWGDGINYDGPDSDPVRAFVVENALYWLREFHFDALRLDAADTIVDHGAYHILEELADAAHAQAEQLNRRAYLIAESGANDPRYIRPPVLGGYGLDGQWADDYHHALHTLLTPERMGYYAGFGEAAQLARSMRQAYVFAGDYAPHSRRRFGRRPEGCRPEQFVVCNQNHDQVGNRALGDRLTATLNFDQLKLAATATLLAPFLPLIFMGEEYAEPAPFQFFTDHSDPQLVRNVREGRKKDYAAFMNSGQAVPDPQDPATFERSRLDHGLRERGRHQVLRELYRELLRLRRELPALRPRDLSEQEVDADEQARLVSWRRWSDGQELWGCLHFGASAHQLVLPAGRWNLLLDTAAATWNDPDTPNESPHRHIPVLESVVELAPHSFVLLERLS